MQTIKFRSSQKKLTPITDSDTAIAHLKSVHLSLTQQIALLTTQSQTYTIKAREATAQKNRILALSALKSRKLTEGALSKRIDALSQIEAVLAAVEQAASDAEIIQSLEGGTKALDALNREIGGIERVERVMERVREGVEGVEEVGRAIAEMGAGGGVDEEEVLEEFDEMVRVEEERLERERLAKEEAERKVMEEQEREAKENAERKKVEEKHDGLVEELKNVSLTGPEKEQKEMIEEAIPA